jgi:branched-chain amino acid transport system ATP-binding protein
VTAATNALLQVQGLHAGYGRSPVLFGVDLSVGRARSSACWAATAWARPPLVRSVMGAAAPQRRQVRFAGPRHHGRPSHRIARRGWPWCLKGGRCSPTCRCEEHLGLCARGGGTPARLDAGPPVRAVPAPGRAARSHGQPAVGRRAADAGHRRALVTNPQLLILDEATEGLAPLIREEIWRVLLLLREPARPSTTCHRQVRGVDMPFDFTPGTARAGRRRQPRHRPRHRAELRRRRGRRVDLRPRRRGAGDHPCRDRAHGRRAHAAVCDLADAAIARYVADAALRRWAASTCW